MTQESTKPPAKDTLNLHMFPARVDAGEGQEITQAAAAALIVWAERYGLDAWAGHTCYMYGRPYVTMTGAIANAEKHPDYRGCAMKPMDKTTRAALGLQETDSAWVAQVFRKEIEHPFEAHGVVTALERAHLKERMLRNTKSDARNMPKTETEIEGLVNQRLSYIPVWTRPGLQAQARAVRRAHLLAYPIRGLEEQAKREGEQ